MSFFNKEVKIGDKIYMKDYGSLIKELEVTKVTKTYIEAVTFGGNLLVKNEYKFTLKGDIYGKKSHYHLLNWTTEDYNKYIKHQNEQKRREYLIKNITNKFSDVDMNILEQINTLVENCN